MSTEVQDNAPTIKPVGKKPAEDHVSFSCPSPPTPEPSGLWLLPLSPEPTVYNGSRLISKGLHKRSPQDEQIVVIHSVMLPLKFHRHWYVSAELDGRSSVEKAAYVSLVVSCTPARSESQWC